MRTIKVLGIDMAFENMGLVCAEVDMMTCEVVDVTDLKLVKTEKGKDSKQVRKSSDDLRRARELQQAISEASSVAGLAMAEVPGGSQSARAAKTLGIATGVLASVQCPLIEVSPEEVKLASVGKKTASKEEMRQWAFEKHPNAGWMMRKLKGEFVPLNDNEHLADALAAIYAGVKTPAFRSAVAMLRSLSA
jgi:Holliday junction resolvasome RuvABC endonuclease subunit